MIAGVLGVEGPFTVGQPTDDRAGNRREAAEDQNRQRAQRELVADAGAQGVVVTPQEVRTAILRFFGNPEERPAS